MTKQTPEQKRQYAKNRRRKLASDPEALARHREVARRSRERNREAHNRRRREKYANDPAYRAARLAEQRKNVDHPHREVNGVSVRTFTVAQTAAMLSVTRQAVHSWIRTRDIPTPTFNDRPILFTSVQVGLMQKLVDAGMNQEARMQARKLAYAHWSSTRKIN